jgi:hypothetical protein
MVNAGKQMVKSLTIDPVMAGFTKYEQKTNSVKTIMNATGLSLEKVNEELNSLQWFADETSYSFTDMVSNIGKFTGQGIDLKTSVTAMKGIANWAALSGQNAESASRAMYNLSQSIGLGSVQLIDWKSISLASMDTKEFKQRAISIAKDLGMLNKAGKTKQGTQVTVENFSSTLADKWFSKDVLLKTLNEYGSYSDRVYKYAKENNLTAAAAMKEMGGDMDLFGEKAFKAAQEAKTFTDAINATKDATSSGWANTAELIFGNYEEARVLWTDFAGVLNDVFVSSLRTRNALLLDWKILGGRTSLIEGISNAWTVLTDVFGSIKGAFRDIFPPMTAETLFKITDAFKSFMSGLIPSEETLANIRSTFRGLFAVLDIGWMAVKALSKAIIGLLRNIKPAGKGILSTTANIGEFIVKIRDAIKTSDAFNKIIGLVADTLKPVINFFKGFAKAMGEAFASFKNIDTSGFDAFADKVKERFRPISSMGEVIRKVFEVLGGVLRVVLPYFAKFATLIGNAFSAISKGVSNAMGNGKGFNMILDLINSGILAAIFAQILKFVGVMNKTADSVQGFFKWGDQLKGIIAGVKDSFKSWQDSLKAKMIMQIAIALAILAGSLFVLSMIDSDKLSASLAAITVLFAELFASMAIFDKLVKGSGFKSMGKVTIAMISLSLALLILSSAVKKLSGLSWEELANGLTAVMVLMASLVAAARVLEKGATKLVKGAFGLIIFATAIVILTKAVETLGKLDAKSLIKGIGGVIVLMGALTAFMAAAKFNKLTVSTAFAILLLSTAMNVLASAVAKIGALSVKQIIKGIGAIGLILAELIVFMKFMPDTKKMVGKAIALNIIAASMLIFGAAIKQLGQLSVKELAKGLGTIAATLASITLAMKLMPDKGSVAKSAAILIIASSMLVLSKAIKTIGSMSGEELGKGLLAIAYSLLVFALSAQAMEKAIPGAAAILIISAAMAILGAVMKSYGEMSWEEILKSLIMLSSSFIILGVATAVLQPLIPAMLGLAAAIALLGVGLVLVGAGVLAFSMGLTALAVAGTAGAAAMVVIVTALIGLIPLLITKIAEGILAFINLIADNAVNIANAVLKVGSAILTTIATLTPQIIDTVLNIVTTLLVRLAEKVPLMVDSGMKIILGFLRGIADNIQSVIEAGADIIVGFLDGIAEKLPAIIDSATKVVISFINGLAESIRTNQKAFRSAVWNLITSIIEAVGSFLGDIVALGVTIVTNIISGIGSMGKKLWDSVVELGKNVVNGIIEGIKNLGGNLLDEGVKAVNGMVDGIKKFLGIKSPSKVGIAIGEFFDKGLIGGITNLSGKVASSATGVGETVVSSMQKAISGVADLLSDQNGTFSPVITPVIDMTDVDAGFDEISERLSTNRSMSISAGANIAASKMVASMPNTASVQQVAPVKAQPAAVNYIFNQTNNSPKPLSRLDVYRNSKNLFSQLKGQVTGT